MKDIDEFMKIVNAKNDESWQRYKDGWPELVDRYNVTAALVRGPDVLDVGCGEGLLLYLLTINRLDITGLFGLDASPEMIRRAEAVFGKQVVEIKQGFAEELPYTSERFSTVVLGQVLEHVQDPLTCVLEALRVLKQGGRIIVNVPADERGPHGNHLRVFKSISELTQLFGMAIDWTGEGLLHRYWYAWGERR